MALQKKPHREIFNELNMHKIGMKLTKFEILC